MKSVNDVMGFAEKVRYLLKQQRLSQSDLAKAIGTNQPQVSRWLESANTLPKVPYLLKIARALSVPVDYLIDDEVDEPPAKQELTEDEKALLRLYRALKPALGEDEAMRRLAGQPADWRAAPLVARPLPGQSETELSRREEEEQEAVRRKGRKGVS
jgi:transcriptional regulator with XRE-family HTH domain